MQLMIEGGPSSGKSLPLASSDLTIGRGEANDLVLSEQEVSRHHARLQRRPLSAAVADQLAQVLRAANYFLSVADTAQDVASYSGVAGKVAEPDLLQMLKEYRTSIARFLFRADPQSAEFQPDDLQQNAESIVMSYQPLKRAVLIAGGYLAMAVPGNAPFFTGLAVVDTGSDFSPFGQVVILVLFQFGGLGLLTLGTLLTLASGGKSQPNSSTRQSQPARRVARRHRCRKGADGRSRRRRGGRIATAADRRPLP